MKKIIHTKNAPAAIGTYSQGVVHNGLLFTSGQIPIDPETGEMLENDFS
ncbi:MAG: RidA family protein, partial [Proteobacteria bacterium]|nr:RidA family protein [Pseudomonadota bacterium]